MEWWRQTSLHGGCLRASAVPLWCSVGIFSDEIPLLLEVSKIYMGLV
jgi:hypothetical protein